MTVLEVLQKMRSTDKVMILVNIGGVDVMREFTVQTHIEKYASDYLEMNVAFLTPMPAGMLLITAISNT